MWESKWDPKGCPNFTRQLWQLTVKRLLLHFDGNMGETNLAGVYHTHHRNKNERCVYSPGSCRYWLCHLFCSSLHISTFWWVFFRSDIMLAGEHCGHTRARWFWSWSGTYLKHGQQLRDPFRGLGCLGCLEAFPHMLEKNTHALFGSIQFSWTWHEQMAQNRPASSDVYGLISIAKC